MIFVYVILCLGVNDKKNHNHTKSFFFSKKAYFLKYATMKFIVSEVVFLFRNRTNKIKNIFLDFQLIFSFLWLIDERMDHSDKKRPVRIMLF